jgi:mannose-6-phosphate isomerase-like protein (cupin superfamily)
MRIVLLLSLLFMPLLTVAQSAPTQPPPAQPRPGRAAASAYRTAMVITVTDPKGATLRGIRVETLGVADRSGETDENGSVRFANMRAGTYRLRFSGEGVIAFERDVNVRAGTTADFDVTLNPADDDAAPVPDSTPAQTTPPATSPTAAAAVGPPGEPKTSSILTLLEKEIIRREPRKETALGCTGNARSTMIQINEQQPERLYENGEAVYYVIGGEGAVRLNGRESAITTSEFIQVPRGTSHAFVRKGKRPLIMFAVLSGEPCSGR